MVLRIFTLRLSQIGFEFIITPEFKQILEKDLKAINTFDIDGVITVGLYPGPDDVIITGRSFEEAPETYAMLRNKGINNAVFFNSLPFDVKCRKTSGFHKGLTIERLIRSGVEVAIHFEDDEIQKKEIENHLETAFFGACTTKVVHIVHDLTEKENVRHPMPEII
jgi:hypothetical protein